MKKAVSVLIVGMLILGLFAGCSDDGATDKGSGEKIYRIGVVQPMDHPSLNQIRDTIEEELNDLGYEGKVELVFENANGDMSLLPTIMQELINSQVDMIVPIATPSAQAAAATTETIPIVFSAVSNPVEAGLVTSFENTDKNITGVSNSIAIEDIFELAGVLTPEVETFGFIYNSSEINSSVGIERAKAYCEANGIPYREATITGTADLQQVASSLVGSVDAFFTPNDNTVASAMATYMQVAMEAKIPTYVGADSMVADGGLATVGIDYTVLGRQTAAMIARIMDGEDINENPVEQIAEYANMINVKTAEALGVTIPESLKEDFVLIGE
ncbi:ABC transporter substrate-binding protein [Alkalibacter rhizosphaerae]|uniref:ABC transporter substrate-binding protein n=1 Tax=Alkalibacter rhizosphaerae TaxID=2815577 RepID=A0A974XFY0_9FIRM|nr:ABC transporter substrate-binding protein [Alkalibacter rhizosphaerae]QSX09026.1 ABC transporter substrate-binding protein [Alkalibacter rhizosphaerae]